MKTARLILFCLILVLVCSWTNNALAGNYVNLTINTEKWYLSEGTGKYTTLRLHTKVTAYLDSTYRMHREILQNGTVVESDDLIFNHDLAGNIFYHGKLAEPEFSKPILWVDAPLSIGKTWTDSRVADNGVTDPDNLVHYVFAVLDQKTITCPAGTFPCYRVFLTAVYPDGHSESSSFWYNENCGMVMCAMDNMRIFKLMKVFVGSGEDADRYDVHSDVSQPELTGLTLSPNPANPLTSISFDLDRPARVDVVVFDVSGRLIKRLAVGQEMAAGPVSLDWHGVDESGRAVASGVYLYQVKAGTTVRTERLTLVR